MKPDNQMPINNSGGSNKQPVNPKRKKSGRKLKNIIFYTIIVFLIVGIFATLQFGAKQQEVAFSDLVKDVNDGKVAKIVESGSSLSIYMKNDAGEEEEYPSKTSRIPTGASYQGQVRGDATRHNRWHVVEPSYYLSASTTNGGAICVDDAPGGRSEQSVARLW